MNSTYKQDFKVALITGGAQRIGAELVQQLHASGLNIALHYRSSADAATALAERLNQQRADSVILVQGDLLNMADLQRLVDEAASHWQRLDVLVNNASSFYPTVVGQSSVAQWDDLMGTNLKAPFFLAQAALPHLKQQRGCIINIVDIHAQRPMKGHPIYCAAKAGLAMLTQSLARELGPEVRVNGVAPGAILWPEQPLDDETKGAILERTALKRQGSPRDIARTALFLIGDADYITGQIISVDGGRTLGY